MPKDGWVQSAQDVGYWLSLFPAIAAACSAFELFARRLRQT